MIRPLFLVASLLLATPALAQTAPDQTTPAPSTPPAPPAEDAEAAFEAKAEAFSARMEAMQGEMSAAVTAAGTDTAKRDADLDAIEARYKPDVDTFVADLQSFVATMAPTMPEAQATGMRAGIEMAIVQIRGATAQIRASVVEQSTASPAA
ncbi:hypothetical protein [Brevundimonas subvibrioides]|uniref:PpiC-type peptidyl-prolyl cis-trans isomerase n=1 Tax=Brevundimonas subvibrioides (strain ATCC 15264 / DSM 4735 / LMG 14903 / NBRC 16000 / CB 81) TaxID=633149 RepID=D9QKF0_BRESC|nr:hypothetical protein [Brevundimonas subvibrioides]ADK99775.1 PpiC-type peptidyl-prolyl cis-trans isomerase [Brevundimonas subvibrioides ATCC 15264]